MTENIVLKTSVIAFKIYFKDTGSFLQMFTLAKLAWMCVIIYLYVCGFVYQHWIHMQ